jgi:hypothetical protein
MPQQKRTYSRRNMTKAPSTFSSPPNEVRAGNSKRRKSSPQYPEVGAQPMKPAKAVSQKAKSKKFSGPTSMSYDDMDGDEVPPAQNSLPKPDPFQHLLDSVKAGEVVPVGNTGSLYGGRDSFNSLMQDKKTPNGEVNKSGGKSKFGGLAESLKIMKKDAAKVIKRAIDPPDVEGDEPSDATKVAKSTLEIATMVKRVFGAKEYMSSTAPLPSKDLNKNCIKAQSIEATL